MEKRHLGVGGYIAVWGALVVLAVTTLLVSHAVHGGWGVASSLGFAIAKACLIAWFFMHLSHEGVASRLAFTIAALLVVLLIGFTLGDVLLRPDLGLRSPEESQTSTRSR